jgi:hypothetical protein
MTGRATAAITSGIVVTVLTGAAASSFLLAATWSSIHGGMSQLTLALLSVVALAAPLGCGLLVGWAINGRQSTPGATPPATPMPLELISLNCPHCGCSLKRSAEYSATPTHTVVECPIHGPFHVGPDRKLILGRPPKSEA